MIWDFEIHGFELLYCTAQAHGSKCSKWFSFLYGTLPPLNLRTIFSVLTTRDQSFLLSFSLFITSSSHGYKFSIFQDV